MVFGKLFKKNESSGKTAKSEAGKPSKGPGFLARLIKPKGLKKKDPPDPSPRPEVDALVDSIRQELDKIPPLPQVVLQILREINNPQSSAKSVARIAQSDPALAAAMLRTVNSAMYGLRAKITSVDQAVTMLGFSTVRNLVIRLKLDSTFSREDENGIYDPDDLWVHSMAVADIAEILARRVTGVDRGFVSTFGLMHDIGKMAINTMTTKELTMKWRIAERKRPLAAYVDIEREVFGNDHAKLGEFLAFRWELPETLCEAIVAHHHLSTPGALQRIPDELKRSVVLVHVANQLAKYCYVYAEHMEVEPIDPKLLEWLGLPASMEDLLDARIKGAVSRAIFFAEERSERSLTSVRRTMKLSTGKEAFEMAQGYLPNINSEPRLIMDGEVCGQMMVMMQDDYETEPDDDDYCPVFSMLDENPVIPDDEELALYGASHLIAHADEEGVPFLVKIALEHQKRMRIRAEAILPARFVTRRILANIKAFNIPDSRVDLIQAIIEKRLILMVSCDALRFDRRLGDQANTQLNKALVLAEYGHLLNLGWFAWVEVTDDGSSIMFVSDELGD